MKTARNYCCHKQQICLVKTNLKLLYNSLPEGMCDNEYKSLEQGINDVASHLIADIKTQPYSVLTYMDDGMMTGNI